MAKIFTLTASLFLLALVSARGQDTPNIIWKRHTHTEHLHGVIYSKSQQMLVSAGADRLIRFSRLSDGAVFRTLNQSTPLTYENGIEAVALSPDGTRVASGSSVNLSLWRLPEGSRTIPPGPVGTVFATQFSPNGVFLVSAGDDGKVRVRRASDGAIVAVLNGHKGRVRALAFSPDGRFLVSGAGDQTVRIWRTSDWRLSKTLTEHTAEIRALAFTAAGNLLASAGEDGFVKVWRTTDWRRVRNLTGHDAIINALAFSPDGKLLASSDNSSLRVWRLSDGVVIRNYTSEVDSVFTVTFIDNARFAYGRFDGAIVFAKLAQPPPVLSGPEYTLLLQNNDGRLTEWFMAGNQRTGSAALRKGPAPASGFKVAAFGDLNGDESPDILWQNGTSLSVWFMSGSEFSSSALLQKKAASGWKAVAVNDFNGDGQNDILFKDPQGRLAVWRMQGTTFVANSLIRNGQPIGSGNSVAGVGDFNGDDRLDILLKQSNGSFLIWLLQGTTFTSSRLLRNGEPLAAGWRVAGVNDFDGNGNADLFCQHTNGSLRIWMPDRTSFAGGSRLSIQLPVSAGWRIKGCR